jgi:ribonuclease P protein component
MLPAKNRLVKRKDFEIVHRSGKFFSLSLLALKVCANGQAQTRVGLVVGIKFSKKAVERNRIKRQLREIVRLNLDKMKPGFDVVLIVKKTREEPDFTELTGLVLDLLRKAGVLGG